MKNITIIKFLALIIFCGQFFSACNVLDQKYPMGYDNTQIFNNPDKARLAAIGMYDAMQNSNFFGGRAQIYVDIRSEDTNPASYFGAISTFDPTAGNGIVTDAWTAAYRTISEINTFIDKINANPDLLPLAEKNQYIAEGKFLRAVVYFYLVNFWGDQYTEHGTGLGVPLVLKSFDAGNAFTDEAKIPRSTVAEVYNQIIKDLTEALPDLPVKGTPSINTLGRATKGAVYAMLSRVYLYKEDYASAISNANLVTGYSLAPNLKSGVFTAPPTSSPEIIFFIAHSATDNPNTNNSIGQHYGRTRRADINVSLNYINNFDDTADKRLTELIATTGTSPNFTYWTEKYIAASNADWAPVIRYGEVLLNKAEALAKSAASGVDPAALGIINDIRARSGAAAKVASDFADKAAFVNYILAERRRELAFEGHGSFDLFRNKKGIAAGRGGVSVAAIPYPSDKFALPIPEADITKAPEIILQNPSY